MERASTSSPEPRSCCYRCLAKCCAPVEQRFIVTAFLSFGILFNYMQRTIFYIALVDMTKQEQKIEYKDIQSPSWDECPPIFIESLTLKDGPFKDWSDWIQGLLLSSFFSGYIFSCLLGGYIADKFGAKHIFGATVVLSSACSILTAIVADFGYGPFIVMIVRGLMGFVQGPMFPSAASMITKWSPREERGLLSAVANSGVPFSLFVGNLFGGFILTHMTWYWVFYISSMFGFFWFYLWEMFVFSSPSTHKFISSAEKAFIEQSVHYDSTAVTGELPIKEILTSLPFITVALANFGFDWGFNIVSIELPFYLRNVLNFPIFEIGVVSAIPWVSMWTGSIFFGIISHILISEGIIRKIDMRKIMAFISTVVPGILLVLASWATCSHVLVCLLFSLSMFYAGAIYSGIRLTVVDIAPNFAGVTMSLVNTVGSFAGLFEPLILHLMIHNGGSLMEWRKSFWIATFFMIASCTPYLLFSTSVIQPWNVGGARPSATPPPTPQPGPSRLSRGR